MIVRDIEKREQVFNFGDPYYTEMAYGSGPSLQPGGWHTEWPGMWDGSGAGYDSNWGVDPGMGYTPDFGPGMGFGPGTGMDPGFGPGVGYGPGMGFSPGSGQFGPTGPDCSWGSPMPNEMAELLRLSRDTNQCCRQILEMLRQMQKKHGMSVEE